VGDPRLHALSIQDVEVTSDLSIAKVNVRLMFGGQEPGLRMEVLGTLAKIAPGLRSSLAPILRMRRLPELRFHYDEGDDQRARISDVLSEIEREDEEKRRRLQPTSATNSDDEE
jgi:ribosome-binding factor A